jgi:hypothetical protein
MIYEVLENEDGTFPNPGRFLGRQETAQRSALQILPLPPARAEILVPGLAEDRVMLQFSLAF